jgi:diacylglycerol kinase family enzyme
MSVNSPWCVIANLSTCASGWQKWKTKLETHGIPLSFHLTTSVEEVAAVIRHQLNQQRHHFLFAGGDGTLHHGGNLLFQLAGAQSKNIIIGVLPCGTGNDWVRTFGIPDDKIMTALKQRSSTELNLLLVEFPDGRKRYAFNMVGGALDAAVVASLNASTLRIPGSIKYPIALIKTLLKPHVWNGSVNVDGNVLNDDWMTIQAGFGKYCGGGMYVLPHATQNKPALLLMKPKSFGRIISSLPHLYNGKITEQKEAIAMGFNVMEINHDSIPIPIESDGEWLGTSPVRIRAVYGVMRRLKL